MKKFLTVFLYSISTLIVLSGFFVALAPWIASTSWGQQQVIRLVNRSIPGSIELSSLQLHWGAGQSFKGFRLKDPEGTPVLMIESFDTEATLWQFLFKKIDLGKTNIKELNVTLNFDDQGRTNLQRALGVNFNKPILALSSLSLSHVNVETDFVMSAPYFSVIAQGKTSQGSLEGSFDIHLNIPNFTQIDFSHNDPQTFLNLAQSHEILLNASIVNFPISLLDSLIPCESSSHETTLTSILGDQCDVSLQKTPSDKGFSFDLSLKTPRFGSQLQTLIYQENSQSFIQSNFEGELIQKGHISIQCDSFVKQSDLRNNLFSKIKRNGHVIMTLSQVPLAFFPPFNDHADFSEYLGSFLDGRLEVHSLPNDDFEAVVSLKTPQFVLEPATFHLNNHIQLMEETQLTLKVLPDTLHRLVGNEALILDTNTTLHFLLKSLDLPFDNPFALKTELVTSIPALQFPKLHSLGITRLEQLTLNFKTSGDSHFQTDLKGNLSLLTDKNLPSPLLLKPLYCVFHSEWQIEKGGDILIKTGEITVENSTTRLQASFQGPLKHQLYINKPVQIEYVVTPAAIDFLNQRFQCDIPPLKEPTPIIVKVDPQEINISSFSQKDLQFNGSLSCKKIEFQSVQNSLPLLQDINTVWALDFPKKNISFSLKATVLEKLGEKASPFSVTAQIFLPPSLNIDLWESSCELKASLNSMPTSVLTLFPGVKDFSPLLGHSFDFNFKVFFDPSGRNPGYFDLVTDSENFHLRGRFKIDQNATLYESDKPPLVKFTVTPKGYQFLKKELGFDDKKELKDSVVLTAVLTECDIPMHASKTHPSDFKIKLSSTEIEWVHSKHGPILLSGLISSANIFDHLSLSLQAKGLNTLAFEATVNNLFDVNHELNELSQTTYDVKLNGNNLDPSFFRDLCPIDEEQTEQIEALFGEKLSFNVEANLKQLNGAINLLAEGPHAKFICEGVIDKGILTLNHPITGSIDMTPRLSHAFFSSNVPFLSTAVKGDAPLTLKIDKEGFSCPLFPFNMENVKIGKATLDLGKLHFLNTGDLRAILNLIHPVTDSNIIIWFTPIYMTQDKGTLSIKRFDMLVAGTYALANWGKIRLLKQDSDFILGLGSSTLEYAFGITGLGNNYMLQIPLKVSHGKVKLDQKKVAARISSLIAQTQGGTSGKILGGVLDLVLSEKGEAFPAPTTTPFPWEKKQ